MVDCKRHVRGAMYSEPHLQFCLWVAALLLSERQVAGAPARPCHGGGPCRYSCSSNAHVQGCPDTLRDVIESCLQRDPALRPSAVVLQVPCPMSHAATFKRLPNHRLPTSLLPTNFPLPFSWDQPFSWRSLRYERAASSRALTADASLFHERWPRRHSQRASHNCKKDGGLRSICQPGSPPLFPYHFGGHPTMSDILTMQLRLAGSSRTLMTVQRAHIVESLCTAVLELEYAPPRPPPLPPSHPAPLPLYFYK